MARFPAPFGEEFPNLEPTLGEVVPVFCTILAGFAGLLFVASATAPDLEKGVHEVWVRPLVIFGPAFGPVAGKGFLLWVSAVDFFLFYGTVISVIYAKMLQYRGIIGHVDLHRVLKDPVVHREATRLDQRRALCITACI